RPAGRQRRRPGGLAQRDRGRTERDHARSRPSGGPRPRPYPAGATGGGRMSGGTLYSIYRAASAAAGPLLRGYLERRAKAGKENPERLSERLGYTDQPRPEGKLIWLHA